MRISRVHEYREDDVPAPSAEVTIDIAPEQYIDDLGLFEDKKEFVKFMYRQENLIRNSFEMEEVIEFLKSKHGMNHCGVHPNLTREAGFRIELHHTPFTLFDITSAVVNRRLQKDESLKMQDIAHEVVQLHYLELIGLYPLCAGLCHVFAHADDGGLFIPIENVYGDPVRFADLYYPYFSDALKTKWDNFQVLDKGYAMINAVLPKELQKKYIYVKLDDKHEEMAISTSKLIDFIQELNQPGMAVPKNPIESPRPVDPNRDANGWYILRKRYVDPA